MNKFTDEQMIEIGKARERLEAIRNKVQPYPEIESYPKVEPNVVYVTNPRTSEIQQLKASYIHLQNKLNEHLDKSKKKNQYKRYS